MRKSKIDISELTDIEIYKRVLKGRLSRFPRNFWDKDNSNSLIYAQNITIYLLEKILKWTDKDIKEKLNQNVFKEYKLYGMITQLFNNSPYKALNNAYPEKFKPWELNITLTRFWNEKTAYEFIKWVIKDNNWTKEDIKNKFSKTRIVNLGYDGAMDCIKEDTFGIINKLYPGEFKPWELKQVSIDYWNNKTMGEALKWLLEDKLKLDITKNKIKISHDFLKDNGLGRLASFIQKKKISIYSLVNIAYPNRFKEWEITNLDIWTENKKIQAVRWLVEDKLELDPNTELYKIKAKHFLENGLQGLLMSACNSSPKEALSLAYRKK